MARAQGWLWFAAWGAAGAAVFFSLLAGLTIGIFVLPFAILVTWLVARRARSWPESLGIASGGGVVCLLVALGNRDYQACPEAPFRVPPGETELSCGGLDPVRWLVAGIVLVLLGIVAYALARRRDWGGGGASISSRERIFLVVIVALCGLSLMTLLSAVGSGGGGTRIEIEPARTVTGP